MRTEGTTLTPATHFELKSPPPHGPPTEPKDWKLKARSLSEGKGLLSGNAGTESSGSTSFFTETFPSAHQQTSGLPRTHTPCPGPWVPRLELRLLPPYQSAMQHSLFFPRKLVSDISIYAHWAASPSLVCVSKPAPYVGVR